MDEDTCKNLYQKYLELRSKMRTAGRIIPDGKMNMISSRDIDELDKIANELNNCLEFFSNEELRLLYTDEDIGLKARKIVRERRNEGLL